MKKFLKVLSIVLLLTLMVGCSCSKKGTTKRDYEKETKEVEKLFNTDDSKLVYNNNNLYKRVFYYKDDKITGMEDYYEFSDGPTADTKATELAEKFKANKTFKVTSKGKYVIYTYVEDQFKGKTVKDIKDSYSYLVPVYAK